MVQVIQPRNILGEMGQSVGSGIGDVLKLLGRRERAMKGLESLKNIDAGQFAEMSYPQRVAALLSPMVDLNIAGAAGGDVMSSLLKYGQNLATAQPTQEVLEDTETQIPGLQEFRRKMEGGDDFEVSKPSPSLNAIPNSMSRDVYDSLEVFPNRQALSMRGNPQGLSQNEMERGAANLVRNGANYADAWNKMQRASDYLREQHGIYQGIIDGVSSEAKKTYGNSPRMDMFERKMIREADKQIDMGNLEPNSIMNVARQAAKDVETVINSTPNQIGRPLFEIGLKEAEKKSAAWVEPLLKDGEVQSAVELLMSNDLGISPKTGKRLNGPDWGAVRATGIVQNRVNPDGVKRIEKFAETLKLQDPDRRMVGYSYEKNKAENQKNLTDFLSDPMQFTDKDSLVLIRSLAKRKGIDEAQFAEALDVAKQRRGGEFSPYQNWEESTFLSRDIRPSLREILNGMGGFWDRITGKQ